MYVYRSVGYYLGDRPRGVPTPFLRRKGGLVEIRQRDLPPRDPGATHGQTLGVSMP